VDDQQQAGEAQKARHREPGSEQHKGVVNGVKTPWKPDLPVIIPRWISEQPALAGDKQPPEVVNIGVPSGNGSGKSVGEPVGRQGEHARGGGPIREPRYP